MIKQFGVFGATLCLTLGMVASASAQNNGGDQHSAIAHSTTNHAVGYAYDAATQEEAEAAALARCAVYADDCESRNWSRNACSALAISPLGDGGWGAAWGNTYLEATESAHATCLEYNDSCQIYAWVCNSMAAPN